MQLLEKFVEHIFVKCPQNKKWHFGMAKMAFDKRWRLQTLPARLVNPKKAEKGFSWLGSRLGPFMSSNLDVYVVKYVGFIWLPSHVLRLLRISFTQHDSCLY